MNKKCPLTIGQRHKAKHLLDMLYTPNEFADELGMTRDYIYKVLIPAGLPHTKDARRHIWIHGPMVALWAKSFNKAKLKFEKGEGYCLRCRKPVKIKNPVERPHERLTTLSGQCPKCGQSVSHILRLERVK
jgi:hypothetical protein